MTSPTTVEVLQKARALLEKGWCQGHFAERADGSVAPWQAPDASRFCLLGSVYRAECDIGGPELSTWADETLTDAACDFIPNWNDAPGRTQAEVLDLMDCAIDLAKQREAV